MRTTKEAVVLDPGGDVDDIARAIDAMGAKVNVYTFDSWTSRSYHWCG